MPKFYTYIWQHKIFKKESGLQHDLVYKQDVVFEEPIKEGSVCADLRDGHTYNVFSVSPAGKTKTSA
jgi:hypothetical protein